MSDKVVYDTVRDNLDHDVTRSVIVPTVECEDVTDKRCVNLPSVEESDSEAQACVPVVANPKCDKVTQNSQHDGTDKMFDYSLLSTGGASVAQADL